MNTIIIVLSFIGSIFVFSIFIQTVGNKEKIKKDPVIFWIDTLLESFRILGMAILVGYLLITCGIYKKLDVNQAIRILFLGLVIAVVFSIVLNTFGHIYLKTDD